MSVSFSFQPGETPVLISFPHIGTRLPEGLAQRLSPVASRLPDTDWHVDQLYSWAASLGIGCIRAKWSRTLIDLNRPPDNRPLYDSPGSGLCPTTLFDGRPVYLPDLEPTSSEIEQRLNLYWHPYHQQLRSELLRLRQNFGFAVLIDAHSIRSSVPRLFDGVLPDINLGSNDGRSMGVSLQETVCAKLAEQSQYSWVLNGRFKGGFITRSQGQPDNGIHALQIELAQSNYMAEDSSAKIIPERAAELSGCLESLLRTVLQWAP